MAMRLSGWHLAILLTGLALLVDSAIASAQVRTALNEHTVAPETNVLDKEGIWALHFRFKNPRIITVDVPGRGKKIVWYMWYQVINQTGEPRVFIPDFELVTDRNTVHQDEVLPAVEEAIRNIEDPTRRINIRNSVTIAQKPIPPSLPEATPIPVTGVAIWPDVYDRARDTARFSVFVSGLSNGWTEDDRKVIRRKTLQLNFKKTSDAASIDSRDIRFVENPEWIYRATNVNILGKPPMNPPEEKKPEEEKKPADNNAVILPPRRP